MTPSDTTFNESQNTHPVRAVVFDLDDTLFPQQQYLFSGFRAVADYVHNLYGVSLYDDLIQHYQAGERNEVFRKALARHFKYVEDQLLHKLLHVHRTHNPRIQLFPDARVCMALLISRNIRIGLLVDGDASVQRRKVASLELEPLVDSIVYCDDLIGSRQSPQLCEDAFLIMGLQLGLEPADMIFVGDNPITDFYTPRSLGMGTIRIRHSRTDTARLSAPTPECEPHISLDSMCLLADVLQTVRFEV